MLGFETGRCPNCNAAILSSEGTKGFVLEILKHTKECSALKEKEREVVLEMTLALLEILSPRRRF